FQIVGGVARKGLAAIDVTTGQATSWVADVGGSLPLVGTLVVHGGKLYVGGGFSSLAGQARTGVVSIDLTTGLLTGLNPLITTSVGNPVVKALVLSGNTAYICGSFRFVGGQARHSLAAIDATTGDPTGWFPQGGFSVSISALLLSGSTLYAGGQFS